MNADNVSADLAVRGSELQICPGIHVRPQPNCIGVISEDNHLTSSASTLQVYQTSSISSSSFVLGYFVGHLLLLFNTPIVVQNTEKKQQQKKTESKQSRPVAFWTLSLRQPRAYGLLDRPLICSHKLLRSTKLQT